VIAECFNALMVLSPSASFEFVARFVDPVYASLYDMPRLRLQSRDCLESSSYEEKWTTTFDREFKQTLLLPMALTRSDDSASS